MKPRNARLQEQLIGEILAVSRIRTRKLDIERRLRGGLQGYCAPKTLDTSELLGIVDDVLLGASSSAPARSIS
jgi:hypothetical protein